MADNTDVRSGQDRTRINTGQEHEVRYWTKELGCTPDELKRAVASVGPMADKVREFIKGRVGTQ